MLGTPVDGLMYCRKEPGLVPIISTLPNGRFAPILPIHLLSLMELGRKRKSIYGDPKLPRAPHTEYDRMFLCNTIPFVLFFEIPLPFLLSLYAH